MKSEDVENASRDELQEYLEGRGFAVYDSEHVEELREAVRLDIDLVRKEGDGSTFGERYGKFRGAVTPPKRD